VRTQGIQLLSWEKKRRICLRPSSGWEARMGRCLRGRGRIPVLAMRRRCRRARDSQAASETCCWSCRQTIKGRWKQIMTDYTHGEQMREDRATSGLLFSYQATRDPSRAATLLAITIHSLMLYTTVHLLIRGDGSVLLFPSLCDQLASRWGPISQYLTRHRDKNTVLDSFLELPCPSQTPRKMHSSAAKSR
jgi:hypothetical protein